MIQSECAINMLSLINTCKELNSQIEAIVNDNLFTDGYSFAVDELNTATKSADYSVMLIKANIPLFVGQLHTFLENINTIRCQNIMGIMQRDSANVNAPNTTLSLYDSSNLLQEIHIDDDPSSLQIGHVVIVNDMARYSIMALLSDMNKSKDIEDILGDLLNGVGNKITELVTCSLDLAASISTSIVSPQIIEMVSNISNSGDAIQDAKSKILAMLLNQGVMLDALYTTINSFYHLLVALDMNYAIYDKAVANYISGDQTTFDFVQESTGLKLFE